MRFELLQKRLGERVATARREKKLSQEAVADAAGVDKNTVSAIERGTGNPTLETICKLGNVLDFEIADVGASGPQPNAYELRVARGMRRMPERLQATFAELVGHYGADTPNAHPTTGGRPAKRRPAAPRHKERS
jgi:transcriptional regulator with XRE-family HTH domain